jgi:hypothetical protein
MKKLSLLRALPLVLLAACGPSAEEGNGAVTTRSHTLDAFGSIYTQLRLPIEIEVGAETQAVEVILDENLQDALDLRVVEGTLNIGTTRTFVPSDNTRVIIRVPVLVALFAGGSGDISLTGRQTPSPFELDHVGQGNLTVCTDFTKLLARHHTTASLDLCVPEGAAAVESLNIRSLGSGQVRWEGAVGEAQVLMQGISALTLQGQAESLNLVAQDQGTVDATAFPVVDLDLETSSVELLQVHATGSATIHIASSGDVELSGAPAALEVTGNGSGEVIDVP